MLSIPSKDVLRNGGKRFELEVEPPKDRPKVAMVVPFHAGDRLFVTECLEACKAQEHVEVEIHTIADGCDWPRTPRGVIRHETSGGWGPYRIANHVFRFIDAEFFAIQDADDIPYQWRLWRQVQLLRMNNAEMVSSGMQNFAGDEHEGSIRKVQRQPVMIPGERFHSCQMGRCMNSVRTMRRELFQAMNGFADIHCSADFDFDNRCRFAGVAIVDDTAIVARRRVHGQSLSHGISPMGSESRQRDLAIVLANQELMKQNPTREQAAALGRMI